MSFRGFAYLDIDHPVVAWGVYRGVLVSARATGTSHEGPVSMMFAGMIQHQNNARFYNERLIDSIRMQRFPEQVSRLSGMYFFTDLAQAREAEAWGAHFRSENLAELEVNPVGKTTRVDSNWITRARLDDDGRLDRTDLSWVDHYWEGKARGNSPVWETIVHGRAEVLGTRLRKRAYEVIARAFPNALDTLEVARLGAAVGSDLGQTVAWITQVDPDKYRLAYYLDMRDAKNPQVLDRLKKYEGPRNLRDLAPEKEVFGLADFTVYGCEFTLSHRMLADGEAVASVHRV